MEHTVENDVQRTHQRDLAGLNPTGRNCEACGRHMHDHEWADLDPQGFVVGCVFSPDVCAAVTTDTEAES